MTDDEVDRAVEVVGGASRIAVLTGAGISTDSGIPDFRGPNGIWTKDPKAEKASDIRHYLVDPEVRQRAWQLRVAWFDAPRHPNAGHRALLALEDPPRLDILVTQNVDGLHLEVGHSPDRVIEIHGTVREVECLSCGLRTPTEDVLARVRCGESVDPPCVVCDGIQKSATVSFGQSLDHVALRRSLDAARACDVLLAVGSTLAVGPINAMVPIAFDAGASVVIVNDGPTDYDDVAVAKVGGSISDVLPTVLGGLGNT